MKAPSIASRSHTRSRLETKGYNHCEEQEPPGKLINSDDEPPSIKAYAGHKFFNQIANADWTNWEWQFRNRITSVERLAEIIPFSADQQRELKLVTRYYPLSITPYYLSLINPADVDDPIRRQVMPSILEVTMGTEDMDDPLNEKEDSVVPGLVHRYPDRVLMVLTDLCATLCRHCTRKREWQHGYWVRTPTEVEAMLDYIRHNRNIRDVIISGGDPLTLSTQRLEDVISRIRRIEHVEIIRIGTRFPVVLPYRIDAELCAMLSRYGPIWLNTHFNHVREITPEAAEACDRLVRSGVPVNNQSVLLRGINDTVKAQIELCRKLLRTKVRPYYLFQCDEVQSTEHLRTPVETGIKIIEGMRGRISGLAIPTFVVDLSQGGGKVPLQPNYVLTQTEDELVLRNYQGRIFHYHNPGKLPDDELSVGMLKPNADTNILRDDAGLKSRLEGVQHEDRVIVRS